MVQNSLFMANANQILLAQPVNKAVVTGNIFKGIERITNRGAKNLQKGLNAFDTFDE